MNAYLRAAGQASRTTVRTGPFLDDDAEPTAAEAVRLADVFRAHDRVPRLEYVHEAAPGVSARVVAAGFELVRTAL
jgi:hypothetical protein